MLISNGCRLFSPSLLASEVRFRFPIWFSRLPFGWAAVVPTAIDEFGASSKSNDE